LALALLVGLGLPASAAPNTVVGTGDSVTATESLGSIDGPGHHFGFSQSSVLAQTTGQQTLQTIGQPAGFNTTATQDCTGTTTTDAGGVCPITGQVNGSWTDTGSGIAVVTATVPTPVNAVQPIIFARTTIGTETFVAGVGTTTCNPNPPTAGATISCSFTTVGDLLAGANTVAIRFSTPGGSVDLFGTVAAAVGGQGTQPTGATSLAALQAAGFVGTGTGCVANLNNINGGFNGIGNPGFNPIGPVGGIGFGNPPGLAGGLGINGFGVGGIGGLNTGAQGGIIGRTCQVTGAVNGTATITGSATWALTTTTPAGATVGVAAVNPVAFALTTVNTVAPGEGPFPCTAVAAVGAVTNCNFVTAGNPLIGLTVAVCFATPGVGVAGVTCNLGTVAAALGQNAVILPNLPILPPPPLEFIPPPPPPLLPPPPPAPLGAVAAARPMVDVPIIPEADSLFLVIGGLVALGGLAGYRSLRRRRDDEA